MASSTSYARYNGLAGAAASSSAVTSVSVASANGLAGTSSGGTTPTLTLSTSVTGLLKGNGTAISAAVSGTDYVVPSVATLSSLASIGTITTGVWNAGAVTSSGTIQGNAFTRAGTGDQSITGGSVSGLAIDIVNRSSKLSIALTASSTITIPSGFTSGLFTVSDAGTARAALFFLSGSTIALVSDPGSNFSITNGTAAKINVTCSAGVITIQNNLVAGGLTAQSYMVAVA